MDQRVINILDELGQTNRAYQSLRARRIHLVRVARDAGATLAQIGETLGISRQGAASLLRQTTAASVED